MLLLIACGLLVCASFVLRVLFRFLEVSQRRQCENASTCVRPVVPHEGRKAFAGPQLGVPARRETPACERTAGEEARNKKEDGPLRLRVVLPDGATRAAA